MEGLGRILLEDGRDAVGQRQIRLTSLEDITRERLVLIKARDEPAETVGPPQY